MGSWRVGWPLLVEQEQGKGGRLVVGVEVKHGVEAAALEDLREMRVPLDPRPAAPL